MIELRGKYNSAKVFTDNVEETAIGQIIELCNQEFVKDSKIRIMPDTHAGAGCTIGTTMTIQDKIVPNLVGVDIGCGMEVVIIKANKDNINFDKLDDVIRKNIPSGFSARSTSHDLTKTISFNDIKAPFNLSRAEKSVGTLGGGNHFIEINEIKDGYICLVIHSGSRGIGKSIAVHYQDLAYNTLMDIKSEQQYFINKLKSEGKAHEIQSVLSEIKKPKVKKELAWLEGDNFKDYMNDMKIAQSYATLNRKVMASIILEKMNWKAESYFTTIHNYIDMDSMILRKGAISARKNEMVIVPINMRDGSIIAVGKGNPDWNYSGPHGAGRLMSRSKAKELVKLEDFKMTMDNVWTTSVTENTLDESPFAYKPIEEIIENIGETLEIKQIVKPLYNFKAN